MIKKEEKKHFEEVVHLVESCGHIGARIIDAGYARNFRSLQCYEQEGKETLRAIRKKLRLLGLSGVEQPVYETMAAYLHFSKSRFREKE